MQVAAHVHSGHDDGFAAEHYVLLSLDVGSTRDLVTRILRPVNQQYLDMTSLQVHST